jgi:Ran GTPase-activating protein (RanGAP) involved in mRNA processing and transport
MLQKQVGKSRILKLVNL